MIERVKELKGIKMTAALNTNELRDQYQPVMGLEIHAQLSTNSKIFCSCPAKPAANVSVADVGPNEHCCEVCAGHPGTLPVLNKKVVELAIRAGLALNCKINLESVFSRKNYFYPDLPKGYQISQFDKPICSEGWVDIEVAGQKKRIRVERIHIEEDAGKNLHFGDFSLVNLNRACVPLIEIVSRPDIRSPEEASAYMKAVYELVTAVGVCDGNLQEGNFRCDANVSVMKKGSDKFGTRAEIKNVNSFRFVEQAVNYEIDRQIEVLESGGKIVQETRQYDSAKGVTVSLRSKEEAHDYRYFPEPDLMKLSFSQEFVEEIKRSLPELPAAKRDRYENKIGLSAYDAGVLMENAGWVEYFEEALRLSGKNSKDDAKTFANVITGEIARLEKEKSLSVRESQFKPKHLVEVAQLIREKVISNSVAKQITPEVWDSGKSFKQLAEEKGLVQVNDTGAIEKIIQQVIEQFPEQVGEFRSGKEKVFGFLVGQAMKIAQGKANPAMLQEALKSKLKS